jgi:hypothetical protein
MTPVVLLRMGLLLLAVALFMYGLNSGADWARWAAVACAGATLMLRLVDSGRRR